MICPICGSDTVKNHGDDGKQVIAHGEIVEDMVEMLRCDEGHVFYLPAKESKPNYP